MEHWRRADGARRVEEKGRWSKEGRGEGPVEQRRGAVGAERVEQRKREGGAKEGSGEGQVEQK